MKAALEAVASGSSISRAAVDHGVPATMLKDRLAGWVQHGDKPGPKPYLDQDEEKELGDFFATVLVSWVWKDLQRCNGHSTICRSINGRYVREYARRGSARDGSIDSLAGRRAWL